MHHRYGDPPVTREVDRTSAAPFDLLNVMGASREESAPMDAVFKRLGVETCTFCGNPDAKRVSTDPNANGDAFVMPVCDAHAGAVSVQAVFMARNVEVELVGPPYSVGFRSHPEPPGKVY